MNNYDYMQRAMSRSRSKKVGLFLGHCLVAPFLMVFFTLRHLLWAFVLSLVFTAGKWILSLLSICSSPTWRDFLFGALALWAVAYIYSLANVIVLKYHYLKDPMFEDANRTIGISWRNYKRLKEEGD